MLADTAGVGYPLLQRLGRRRIRHHSDVVRHAKHLAVPIVLRQSWVVELDIGKFLRRDCKDLVLGEVIRSKQSVPMMA